MKSIYIYLLFAILFKTQHLGTCSKITVSSVADSSNDTFIGTYTLYSKIINDNNRISGQIAVADPFDACYRLNNPEELKGKIALIDYDTLGDKTNTFSCVSNVKVERARKAGAIGVILVLSPGNKDYKENNNPPMAEGFDSGEHLPAITVKKDVGDFLVQYKDNTTVTFEATSSDESMRVKRFIGLITFHRIFFSITHGLLFIGGIFEIGLIVKHSLEQDHQINFVPWVIIGFSTLAVFLRSLYLWIDPFNYDTIFTRIGEAMLYGLSTGFVGCAFTSLILSWMSIASTFSTKIPQLLPKHLLIVYFVLLFLIIVGQIVSSLLYFIDQVGTIYNIILAVYIFLLGAGFIVYGARILRILRGGAKLSGNKKIFRKFTMMALSFSFVFMLFVVSLLIYIASDSGELWIAYEIIWRFLEVAMFSLLLFYFFNKNALPKSNRSSASGKGNRDVELTRSTSIHSMTQY